ncbi:LysR substrate-binding domain-containing protein [Sulfitobacter aestuariivivens]|uniref:LysR family transcriptional regulator n=1 Tax=Sulfitobacter aestuariivivens TaxID=2766981 RepID=A0A927HGH1_9RHOB|nr:LysR substrate-binding domain-containing protein [Sulfitobacter aestuariivivens]MBD3665469.1 LysR family transcriptional regulator [Sulfitobacter aestuariivivens]
MAPRDTLPPLNWLRAFEAAARTLSFTGAALELNMTQSAVSQQIKSLEGHLGRPLFHRRPRTLEMTETGLSYLPVVRDAFRTLSHGTRAITRATQDVLQIQCNLTFAIHWLAPRLGAFRRQHPDIQLNISTEIWQPRDMAKGIDIEIRHSLRPADTIHAELLYTDFYYPVCAADYPVTLETLHQQPLFDCTNMMGMWSVWAEEQSLNWPNPPITYASTYSVSLAVALSGGGLALAYDLAARQHLQTGALIAPFSHRAPMQEAFFLLQSPQAAQMEQAVTFCAWLRSELRNFGEPTSGRDQSGRLATQA